MKLDGFRADDIIRTVAHHRSPITGKDYAPLLKEMIPVHGWISIDEITNRFTAFESAINPRWDGSIA